MNNPSVRVGVAVFVLKNGEFLMMQRKGSHGTGTWSVPGGHLEFGESFEDTALREVMEETGLEITNVRFGGITNDIFENDNKHYVTIWLLSDWKSGEEYIAEPDKCVAQEWSTFEKLPTPLFQPCWDQLRASDFIDEIKSQAQTKTA